MGTEPQDLDPLPVAERRTLRLAGSDNGSRLRLSADLLRRIDWRRFDPAPSCWGFFRYPGELLCAPKELLAEDGEHPFGALLRLVEVEPEAGVPKLADVPSGRIVTASDRLISFETAWTANQTQLSLKLGRDVSRRLGWSEESQQLFANNWGSILILLSQDRYDAVQRMELTGTP